ncbi:MAG: glycoside hydrolase family 3 C-terminal domain-containing protein [Eubacteriales bacterium]|nr:glycoside hydrolase family 3 C-terminal domain-containing protein [Eubacteriales bacterium]
MKRDVKALIQKMTLEEKASLCSGADFWNTKGVERLGIPQVMVTDGPHGLRKQEGSADHLGLNESISAVCFPAACAAACSFDTNLLQEMGETLGVECQAENVSMLLGPAVNIKRSPLCGRNFEYFSEDPQLTGKLASAYIKGVQSKHVGTSIKHFAVNNQEYRRMSASSNLSTRTLREIYLPAFEEAIRNAAPKSVMCSYNKINGVFASENEMLLTEILRNEWGFEGLVVSDWGAVNDRVKGLAAGLDLEMPGSGGVNDEKIVQAVRSGEIKEEVLDQAVKRILQVIFDYADNRQPDAVFDREKDHRTAVKVECESAVLLENDGILPLDPKKKIVYIREFAAKPRYQGGGSSHIHASQIVSAFEAAQRKNRNVTYTKGFPMDRDEIDTKEFEKAVNAAKEADAVVIFAGLPDAFESEGYDRKNMKLPDCQNVLIQEIEKVQSNIVVVLHNGSPVETPWADEVSAVLEMYLGGQGVGDACDQLLYGEVNPSGRLAETFPIRLEDNPSYLFFGGDGKNVDYAEGIYVGYRYYDAKQQKVRWPFGHGLSYTSFLYQDIRVTKDEFADNDSITVEVDIKNIGEREGKEVVQLYVADKNGTPNRPLKELKGFAKVNIRPGEVQTVTFTVSARDLSYYHEELGDWFATGGAYELLIGHSSADIRLTKKIHFVTDRQLPLKVTGETTVGELLEDARTCEMMKSILAQFQSGAEETADEELMVALLEGMPLRSLLLLGVPAQQIEELIAGFNTVCR